MEESENTGGKKWTALYTAVVVVLVLIIVSLYFFTKHFE
jgi:hypothetical protein